MSARPSLEVIAAEVQREREAQLRHFESLDTKAGIVLGFAGVLVALGGRAGTLLGALGQITAAVGALLAVAAFFPRVYPVLRLRHLRDRYLQSERGFTELHLLDTYILMAEEASYLLRRKAWWLKLAAALLAAATGILGIEGLLR